jgi:hypothetical protein
VFFSELSEESATALHNALAESKPTYSPQELARQVGPKVDIPEEKLRGVFAMLGSLYVTREHHGLSIDGLVADIKARVTEERLGGLEPDSDRANAFADRIKSFLSLDRVVGVTARAANVMVQHKNPFRSARILSDVRPVFVDDGKLEPAAGLIIHNLQVLTSTDQQTVSFYAALDSQDLLKLKNVIERAILKEEELRRTIEAAGMFYIDVPSS